MKRFWILILALALICACALGLSEEAFFAEESFSESALTDESFFSEEAFSEDGFFAEEPAAELAAPDEEADEAEARSVITLELELLNTEEEDLADWQAAPVLVAESQKKDGAVTLTWAQEGIAALDKDTKYYVYAVDPATGAGWQVGKPAAPKKNISVKYDGEVVATGIGGTMKLTKQTTGTEYFVRAEKVAKAEKKAVGNAETYGKSSNHVTYTGDDGLWKTVQSLKAEDEGYGEVCLFWTSTWGSEYDGYTGESILAIDFQVERTAWVNGKKLPPEKIGFNYNGFYFDIHNYSASDNLPEGTTKVQYSVTPIKDGISGKTAKTQTLTFQQDAWKMVSMYAQQPYTDEPDEGLLVHATLDLRGGIADTYVFKGFSSNASIALNEEGIFYPVLDKKGTTPIKEIYYDIEWTAEDAENPGTENTYYQNAKIYQDENEKWIRELLHDDEADIEAMKNLANAKSATGIISVTGLAKDSLQATITVTPQKAKKNGVASKYTCELPYYWKNAPGVSVRLIGENRAAMTAHVMHPQPGDQYIVKGFAGNVTATLRVAEDESDEYDAGDYYLDWEDPKGVVYQAEFTEDSPEGTLYFDGLVKGSTANFTVQVKRKVDNKMVSGKVSDKAKVAILPATAKSSVFAAQRYVFDISYVSFMNLNPNVDTFRISVAGTEKTLVEFRPDDLEEYEQDGITHYRNEDGSVTGYESYGGVRYNVKVPSRGVILIETILKDGTRIVDTANGHSYVE